jgi:hypothetical protein
VAEIVTSLLSDSSVYTNFILCTKLLKYFISLSSGYGFKIVHMSWAPVAHVCNPSYSGGRDQEDRSSKPAWANRSSRPYLEKTLHKNKAGRVAQGEGPEFKAWYHQKKKKKAQYCNK